MKVIKNILYIYIYKKQQKCNNFRESQSPQAYEQTLRKPGSDPALRQHITSFPHLDVQDAFCRVQDEAKQQSGKPMTQVMDAEDTFQTTKPSQQWLESQSIN